MINKKTIGLTLLSISFLVAGVEKKINLSDVPVDILNDAKKTLPDAKFHSANTEIEEDGSFVYEIQGLLKDGRKFEYDVKKNGDVEEIEIEFPTYMVPKAVIKAIDAKFKDFKPTYIEASHSKSMKVIQYEFEGLFENKKLDLEVSADGRKIIQSDK